MRPVFQDLESVFKAIARWYFLEAIAAVCLISAFTDRGPDRVTMLLVSVLAGTVAVRLRFGDRSGFAKFARAIQVVVGSAAALGGAALVIGGLWLATLGSFALLAAPIVVIVGAGVAALGYSMARIGTSKGSVRAEPNPPDWRKLQRRAVGKVKEPASDADRAAGSRRVRAHSEQP